MKKMRKRYMPAFILEGMALAGMAYNLVEMLVTRNILMMRPMIWVLGVLITILTTPAFILWLLERKERKKAVSYTHLTLPTTERV